jgi:hypothetical protein
MKSNWKVRELLKGTGFTRRGKQKNIRKEHEVSGHEFIRADKAS